VTGLAALASGLGALTGGLGVLAAGATAVLEIRVVFIATELFGALLARAAAVGRTVPPVAPLDRDPVRARRRALAKVR